MTITMAQALAATRIRLNESTSRAWTDDEIRGWVNEAVAEIARETMSLNTSSIISTVAEQRVYALPTDVLEIHRFEFWSDASGTYTVSLEIADLNELDEVWHGASQNTLGVPRYVALTGYPPALSANLYPIPTTSTGKIVVHYAKAPANVALGGGADATVLQIPAGWEDLIYEKATELAQRRDANPAWQETRAVFDKKLDQMKMRTQFFHDQGGTIVHENESIGDYFPWGY